MELLNQAFPKFWDRTTYQWYLERQFGGEKPDILVRADGQRLLAAVTLVPRAIAVGGSAPVRVAIMSAGGTLVSERRRGHYAALLDATHKRARERGWLACLGFVTENNSSGKGLIRLGARAIPSFYITTPNPQKAPEHCTSERPQSGAPPLIPKPHVNHTAKPLVARFHYANSSDWQAQFIHRPNRMRVIRLASDSVAYIESVAGTDRLQRLDCPDWKAYGYILGLSAQSKAAGRNFFMYSLDPRLAKLLGNHHLSVSRGHFTLWPTDPSRPEWHALSEARWSVHSGDRL
jgi:Acetyltransferase (GNAT) domain